MYKTTLGQRISFIAHIVRHFFTDTRWSRAFHIIRYASLKISSFGWCGSQFPSLSSGESRPELFSSWRLRLYQLAHRPSASTFSRPHEQCRVFWTVFAIPLRTSEVHPTRVGCVAVNQFSTSL
jgi:hypothetical protein